MKNVLLGGAALLALAMTACNGGYKKAKGGLEYKIVAGDSKDSVMKVGEFAKFNYEITVNVNGKDSVINSSYAQNMPGYAPVDTATHFDFTDLFTMMKKGDSASFKISMDSIAKIAPGITQAPFYKKGAFFTGGVKVLDVFKDGKAAAADREQTMAAYQNSLSAKKGEEVAAIGQYLKSKNINAQLTKDSVYLVITTPGDASAKADSGKYVSMNYTGSLLESGKVFDSNLDSTFHHMQPLQFVVGQGQVIPGWDKTLQLLGKGAKATFYIPAMMAYGPQAMGDKIPAFSNLKFDVQVLDVTNKQPAAPQMPAMQAPVKAAK